MRAFCFFVCLLICETEPGISISRFGHQIARNTRDPRGIPALALNLRGGTEDPRTDPKPSRFEILIVGGGVSSGYCVKELLAQGVGPGKVCIITEENCHPYERPALTKGYLLGSLPSPVRGGFLCNEIATYKTKGVNVEICSKVINIDYEQREVTLLSTRQSECGGGKGESSTSKIGYDRLILATGADVERLAVPGNVLENIFYIRSL